MKNRTRLTRFEREINALQKLSHRGILRVIESRLSDAEPFYVAEYCERGNLAKLDDLSGKTLLLKLLLYRESCDAVAAAHQAQVIHRDLKPENVLIRKDGSIAVGDFGLCLDLSQMEERATSTSEPVGSWNYIAPELEDGRLENPQPSSDCYSLGKLLYFILSGRSFSREKHRDVSYDLRTPDCDQGTYFVYELLDKTIQFDPKNRYQNAGELVQALDGVIMRIENNAHVLNINVPQHCLYCISGRYQQLNWGDERFELNLVCNKCGNIQKFTAQNSPQKKWWTTR